MPVTVKVQPGPNRREVNRRHGFKWLRIPAGIVLPAVGDTIDLHRAQVVGRHRRIGQQAQQLGLPITRTRTLILLAASLATAAAVSFSGIIGFIGLIVPHVMRLWFGADYRRLIPLSLIGGAAALLLSDVLARVIIAPQELPVGIVTALFGAPFFLWVLRRAKNQGYW